MASASVSVQRDSDEESEVSKYFLWWIDKTTHKGHYYTINVLEGNPLDILFVYDWKYKQHNRNSIRHRRRRCLFRIVVKWLGWLLLEFESIVLQWRFEHIRFDSEKFKRFLWYLPIQFGIRFCGQPNALTSRALFKHINGQLLCYLSSI